MELAVWTENRRFGTGTVDLSTFPMCLLSFLISMTFCIEKYWKISCKKTKKIITFELNISNWWLCWIRNMIFEYYKMGSKIFYRTHFGVQRRIFEPTKIGMFFCFFIPRWTRGRVCRRRWDLQENGGLGSCPSCSMFLSFLLFLFL